MSAINRRIACLDLGSNSFLLCSAEVGPSNFRIIRDECRVVGLAKKLTNEGHVDPLALKRAEFCLIEFRHLLEKDKIEEVYTLATESLRRPKNGAQVKSLLESYLCHPIEIISPEREAELSFWSVEKDPKAESGTKLVFDIGGASTELIVGDDKGIQSLCSLKIGSVVLTEKFNLDRPGSYDEALQYAQSLIASSQSSQFNVELGIGVAGTMTTLIAIQHKIENFKRETVHGVSISQTEVKNCLDRLFQMTVEERKGLKGLPPERADVFGGGALIAYALMKHFSWDNIRCFDSGVRYGLLYEKIGL